VTARLTAIRRHPIKGIGSETLDKAMVTPEGALLGDRAWALLHGAAPDTDDWQPRRNFLVVANGPDLAAVTARTEPDGRITLTHPRAPALTVDPEHDAKALIGWVGPLWPSGSPSPHRLVRAPGHGMTDMQDPFVSIGSLSALRALSQKLGRPLDLRRFRINLWVDGLAPWEEFDRIGEVWSIGDAALELAEPIGRCRAPEANPETGHRDTDVVALLRAGWGHSDFGVYARVLKAGTVSTGDTLALP
jgi:uncharacterized protein YcbX